jgi:hypothetical protein
MDSVLEQVPHYIGWLCVNLAVPYLFPLAVVRLVQQWRMALSPQQAERLRLTYLLKEAQLSLVNVAVAAVGVYELFPVPATATLPSLRYFFFAVLIGMIALNTLLFVFGTVIGNPPVAQTVTAGVTWKVWQQNYPMGAWSIRLGVVSALVAFGAHFVVFSDEHGHQKAAQINAVNDPTPSSKAASH